MDWDDISMEYDELVEAGEIDPKRTSLSDYIADRCSELADKAIDSFD